MKLGPIEIGRSRPAAAPIAEVPHVTTARSNQRPPLNLIEAVERIPIRNFAKGRVNEADMALAATSPILGQYAPQFGWPDDR